MNPGPSEIAIIESNLDRMAEHINSILARFILQVNEQNRRAQEIQNRD